MADFSRMVNGPKRAKKKSSTPKKPTGAAALPGYKVPKKLLKKSKLTMGVREGQKLTPEERRAYKAGTAQLHQQAQAMLHPKKKKSTRSAQDNSDFAKGAAWVDEQYGGLSEAIDKIQRKQPK